MATRHLRGGLVTRWRVASVVKAHVDSVPTRARATWARPGASSSRLNPLTRRGMSREAFRHQRPVPGLEAGQTRQQAGEPASPGHGRLHVPGRIGAHFELFAPRPHDPEALDVVGRLAGVKPVGPARVVADHATEGAPGMGGRVRPEGEPVALRRPARDRPAPRPVRPGPPAGRGRSRRSASCGATCRAPRPRCTPARPGWCPAPRARSAAPASAASRAAARTSSWSTGNTTPRGTWR